MDMLAWRSSAASWMWGSPSSSSDAYKSGGRPSATVAVAKRTPNLFSGLPFSLQSLHFAFPVALQFWCFNRNAQATSTCDVLPTHPEDAESICPETAGHVYVSSLGRVDLLHQQAEDFVDSKEGRSWFSLLPSFSYLLRKRPPSASVKDKTSLQDSAGMASADEGQCLVCHGCVAAQEKLNSGAGPGSYDSHSFARYLQHVHLVELEIVAQMSFLCNLAYVIPEIEPLDLLGQHRLRFVTSSLQEKVQSSNGSDTASALNPSPGPASESNFFQDGLWGKLAGTVSLERAHALARAASQFWTDNTRSRLGDVASEVDATLVKEILIAPPQHMSATTSLLFKDAHAITPQLQQQDLFYGLHLSPTDATSSMATSSAATCLLSAEHETRLPATKDFQMQHSCPCEWFVCDDEDRHIRTFVIQGSESVASWQANLLFEPVQFENPKLQVLVHRGIYEAAKGLYEQFLPHILDHLMKPQASCNRWIRFTGHSLGGSLATLITLMLQIRGIVPPSSLLPVMTFGSPSVMCGGDVLLQKLDLPQSHIQSVVMHRDIVPRSFSCNYPDHVAEVLRRINGTFRDHPCLSYQRLLYAPIGQLMILQPDSRQAPSHPFLPAGSGLYVMADCCASELQAAQRAFLNCPHPLEILSDPGAYGSEGMISRDHDPRSYARAINHVLRKEHKHWRRTQREYRRQLWRPLVCRDLSLLSHSRQDITVGNCDAMYHNINQVGDSC